MARKRALKGIEVEDPLQSTEKLLLELIQRDVLLDWIQQAVSIYETLKAEDMTLQDIMGMLTISKKAGIGNKELVDFYERVRDSKSTITELQQAFTFKSELDGLGMTPSAICEAVNVSKAYGPGEFIKALKAYGTLSELYSLIRKLQGEKAELESSKAGLQAELEVLRGQEAQLKGALEELSMESEGYGSVKGAIGLMKGETSLKEIQEEIGALSSNRAMITASIKELSDLLQELGFLSEGVNRAITGLFDPMRKELEDSTHQLREEATASITDISAKYEEYSQKVAELSLRAGALEEELRIARFIKAVVNYPSEMKDLPLDYDLLMLKGIAQHCRVRGVNPKVKINRNYGYISELEFKELLEMAIAGLSWSLTQPS